MQLAVVSFFLLALIASGSAQKETNWVEGRSTIVHLFEWPFSDVAAECERFLAEKGYAGVQVSPVNENLVISGRPWWERYQPMSYNIITRSGGEAAFLDMTTRCNAVGIRIYVDIVVNHMTTDQDDAVGTGGSTADPRNKYYPGVPFSNADFHSTCSIPNYSDPEVAWACELDGLHDLDQGSDYVRGKIIDFLNHLIELGVAGFRVDCANHMRPSDLEIIYSSLNDLNTDFGFAPGSRPYIYQEVIYFGGESISHELYTPLGDVTEFMHSANIGSVFRGWQKLTYLENWGPEWQFMASEDALVFVDNHDNQRGGAGGDAILTYKDDKQYKMAIAFMLAHTYGTPRVMSSYYFEEYSTGPPADGSGNIVGPSINDVGTCDNGWVCEHRWREIFAMVGFRNAVEGTEVTNWWSDGNQQIAFCRGNKGFIAFTLEEDIDQDMYTCLPEGTYCDVISGDLIDNSCTGKTIYVGSNGYARISELETDYDGVLAIHVGAKLI